MPLDTPRYIAAARIAEQSIRYEWDDWNVHKADRPSDPAFVARTEKLWDRANIALTIACAEWVMHRFDAVYSDPLPFDYLEALWAWNVDWRYSEHFMPIDSEWMGPILGPIELAIYIANDAFINAVEKDPTAINPSWMSNLALHILGDPKAFLKWRERVMRRLEQYYSEPKTEEGLFEEMDRLGPYVPREAFDPEFEFRPEMTDELIDRFLSRLDFQENPFLRLPQQMVEMGFEGKPYSLGTNR